VERHQGKDKPNTGMRMTRAPQILPQGIFHIGRIVDQKPENAQATIHNAREQDQ
jgi:hypothetical protein